MPLKGTERKPVVEEARQLHLELRGAWRAASSSRAFLTCALASRVAGEEPRTCGNCGEEKKVKDFTFHFLAKATNLYRIFTDCKECVAASKMEEDEDKKKFSNLINNMKKSNKEILKKAGLPIITSQLLDIDEAYIKAQHERSLRLGDRLMGCNIMVMATKSDFMISPDRYPDPEGLYSRANARFIPAEGQLMRMGGRLPEPNDFTIKINVTLQMLMSSDAAALVEANAATWRAALERRDPVVLSALGTLLQGCRAADKRPGRAGNAGTITLPELEIMLKEVKFCDAYTGGPLPLPDGTSSFDQLTIDKIVNEPPAIHNRANVKLTHYLLNGFGNAHAPGGICWSRKKWLHYVLNQTLVALSRAERAEVAKAHAAA